MAFRTRISSHNHKTKAPTKDNFHLLLCFKVGVAAVGTEEVSKTRFHADVKLRQREKEST